MVWSRDTEARMNTTFSGELQGSDTITLQEACAGAGLQARSRGKRSAGVRPHQGRQDFGKMVQ